MAEEHHTITFCRAGQDVMPVKCFGKWAIKDQMGESQTNGTPLSELEHIIRESIATSVPGEELISYRWDSGLGRSAMTQVTLRSQKIAGTVSESQVGAGGLLDFKQSNDREWRQCLLLKQSNGREWRQCLLLKQSNGREWRQCLLLKQSNGREWRQCLLLKQSNAREWRQCLLLKQQQFEITSNMCRWIKDFLSNRSLSSHRGVVMSRQ
ncbi:hypothetical protein Btru_028839 [Bulinus truncatus]|nr:hypothetical protein Btru_028839 [Bulinus truncatus]